jgi:hypothetical protein
LATIDARESPGDGELVEQARRVIGRVVEISQPLSGRLVQFAQAAVQISLTFLQLPLELFQVRPAVR